MNINISNFYSDNLSPKASSIIISSPNLHGSFISSLHTDQLPSEGFSKLLYDGNTPDRHPDNGHIQTPYQIPEASVESSYRLDIIPKQRKYSPGLLTTKEERVQQKRAKNFNEFHKSLENLASKRRIGTQVLDSDQGFFSMKGNMSMGNVASEKAFGNKRRFERFNSTQLRPISDHITQSHPALLRPASFYEKDYGSKCIRTEHDDIDRNYQGIVKRDSNLNGQDRNRSAKRNRHHTYVNMNNNLRQTPKPNPVVNSISSTSLYNRDKQTFCTDTKYSFSPNEDLAFNSRRTIPKKHAFPYDVPYYDKEKIAAAELEHKSIDKKVLEFSSVNGSDSKFLTHRTDFAYSYLEHPSIRDSYQSKVNRPIETIQNKGNRASSGRREKKLLSSKNTMHERLDQNSISEGVQYGFGGVGQYEGTKIQSVERQRSLKRKGTEVKARKESECLNETIKDDNHVRVSLQDYRLTGIDKETVIHWKRDLMEIREDIEKRKISYHEISEQLKKYEAEGEKELDAASPLSKRNNEQPSSPAFHIIKNHRRSTRIFDTETLATRVSKEAYDLYNVDWLHKEKKACPEIIRTSEDWDEHKPVNEAHGKRRITDLRARTKTTLCNEFNNETSFGYDNTVHHENRSAARCCGGESYCNAF